MHNTQCTIRKTHKCRRRLLDDESTRVDCSIDLGLVCSVRIIGGSLGALGYGDGDGDGDEAYCESDSNEDGADERRSGICGVWGVEEESSDAKLCGSGADALGRCVGTMRERGVDDRVGVGVIGSERVIRSERPEGFERPTFMSSSGETR